VAAALAGVDQRRIFSVSERDVVKDGEARCVVLLLLLLLHT